MADERDEATENDRRDEATRRMSADDPTSTFDPFADDDDVDADLASTQALPPDVGSTQALPHDFASTRPMPEDLESTRPMSANGHGTPPQEPGVWAARASVPVAADPVPAPEPPPWQEEFGAERSDRSWLRPVLIALVVLVLLAMLGTGLWLIFNHVAGRSAPTTVVPATATAASSSTATAPASQAPPAAPTTAPTAATPDQIAVPDVVGQSEGAARQQLAAYGLTATVARRVTGGAAPGTVIATDPGAGTMVAAGSRVTLVVAAAPVPAPTTATRSASPTPARSQTPPSASPKR
ncbi:PASTA domain-containing protein [Planosporangium thailandense]|uniref:PASTA domain-containing protein n=1 Tax=Planosporangium thailandense TaxID=765197 RepID=A0ABX0XTV8_9ACTN|nr:PASTA domain-containing protein [Planosporangium thailandense]NJC68787.1 PASTA domain-containing protein [Planosporangium thailandense]